MKVIKILGTVWGFIYFAIGFVLSFTLSSNDFWSGVAVYLALFLLPLPITFIAVWFPRIAAVALTSCAVVSICVAVIAVITSGPAPDFLGACKFAMLHVPHLWFAALYKKLAYSSSLASS
jgi:hypothetical protein